MVKIFTSCLRTFRGSDGLDITYKTNSVFSPTFRLVDDYLKGKIDMDNYTKEYYKLMRKSYIENRSEWERHLNKNSIVLLCYCSKLSFCHRFLLKDILVKCGAKYYGEID